jgi:hypothetical protein
MVSAAKLLDALYRTRTGWSDADFFRVLEYYGFTLERQARHGAFYRHADLAGHPDLETRRLARVLIPKGRELHAYVADEVIAAIEAVRALRATREGGEE